MKKILNAIGGFFKKIGRWIKETAWIQPLLIVGAIFGLIMSIKPIANFINDITTVESESNFYKSNLKDYEFIRDKIFPENGDNGDNDVIIVIFIKEENDTCEHCVNQQEDFDNFFARNHSIAEDGRNYSIFVLDIASDEFDEDEAADNGKTYRDIIDDVVDPWGIQTAWDNMPTEFNQKNENIDFHDDFVTPTIARFEERSCVGVAAGYDNYDKFLRFCYADDVSTDKPFQHVNEGK